MAITSRRVDRVVFEPSTDEEPGPRTVGDPTSGTGKELPIIAAVVIGGGSLSGGRGSILGTLTGALIMQVISSGCTALKQPNPIQEIIIGSIIIAAVTVDQIRQRRQAT